MKLISREEIKTLVEQPKENSISIYMPVISAGAEVRQNPIRFKNLIKQTQTRLIEAGVDETQVTQLLQKTSEFDRQGFWEGIGEQGLAIFISNNLFRYYVLPLEFEELVVVSDHFHVKPLLQILNHNGRFYILGLSQNKVRMLLGSRYRCQEIDLTVVENLPTSLDEALQYDDFSEQPLQRHTTGRSVSQNAQAGVFHGQAVGTDGAEHKTNIMRFFKALAKGLENKILHDNEQVPLILAGVDFLIPMYKEANSYQYLMEDALTGNPEILSPQELHSQALPIVENYWNNSHKKVIDLYNELLGSNSGNASNDLEEIVTAAYYQKIDTLLVAQKQHKWGLFDPGSQKVYLHSEEETGDEDLLDLAAAHTLINGGMVYVLEAEQVPSNEPVAAIFRY
ncbi:hypothetical protein IQ247_20285 [Plectonema cf. radiosum LEGE 06105]|uniref:Uncharacterized protein n=1 Tax=Plectonema cf. radiosum LEGE 06105 TaxID=945769 RepID=A0A8J7JUF4_9CYAN|nr:hypothetical protein [Plectonema radiosum]MBE9214979.1 hypothetical protein [Plectonema cf. radiosum LEGE 06105]